MSQLGKENKESYILVFKGFEFIFHIILEIYAAITNIYVYI